MRDAVSPYRVGEWDIDPRRGVASRQDKEIHLEPKVVELLGYLVSRRGEVVSRAELLDAVWPGVIVSDEVITNAIAKLRRSLQDDPKSSKLIETIPKRGYRIIAPVTEPHTAQAPTQRRPVFHYYAAAAVLAITVGAALLIWPGTSGFDGAAIEQPHSPLPDKPSVVVLPLKNLGNDSGQEDFVDGMTEDLITDLSRISGLFVIARNSSFSYKNKSIDLRKIGRQLGVQFVTEGSVRRAGNKLRINIQLIEADTGKHIWAERYDGEIDDVFRFQDKITARIVAALSVHLTGTEKDLAAFQETHKSTAYEAFLKGWASYRRGTPQHFAAAIVHFEKALQEDPAYGRAHAALAAIYWEAYQKRWYRRLGISPVSAAWQKANEYLEKSMVAPTPLAHKVSSEMLTTNRRFDEAITEAQRAIAIDPNDPLGHLALADALIFVGSPDEAERLVRKAMRLDPQDPAPYLLALGKAQLARGAAAEAAWSLEQAMQRTPDNRLGWMALISAYGLLDQSDKAESAVATLNALQHRDKLVSFTVANASEHWPFKSSGDRDRFLDGLRKAGVPEW